MKKKGLETILFSGAGIAAMLLILVAFNVIAAYGKQRIDLTAEKAYTLSAGTRAILARIDTPVEIRYYCTRDTQTMPVALTNYAQRVEDLLGEYKQAAKGKIEIKRLNPTPDSDAEDSARLDGVEGQPLRNGERIYLGLSVSMLDQKQAVPFLTPDRERLLEYDISRALARVLTPEKPAVGWMSPLPVMGEMNPATMRRGQPPQPWAFMSELQRDFKLKEVAMTADKIPDDINLLLVIHPKGISEATEYALDQFVLRGGKLIAFVDPLCTLDRNAAQNPNMPPQSSSTLNKLFKAWGVNFSSGKVVADLEHVARLQETNPAVLALDEHAINREDVVTADTENLLLAFCGAFSGAPAEGLTKTDLLKTSKRSELVDPMMASFGGAQIVENFQSSDTEYALAIRLSGKFKSAFPEGKPKPATEASPALKPEENAASAGLKESAQPTTVILIGDADMIQDPVSAQQVATPNGQTLIIPMNGNLAFGQGALEQMAGDVNLIAVRSRSSRERPFTVVQKLQADAEANYRSKIKELEGSLAETQRKVNELQQSKDAGQRFILSPEQQRELVNFRQTEANVKTQLKEMRRKLRSEIDSLENRIKWVNIAGMPLVVVLIGFGLALTRRSRAAK